MVVTILNEQTKHRTMIWTLSENTLLSTFSRIGYYMGVMPIIENSSAHKQSKIRKLYLITVASFISVCFMFTHHKFMDTKITIETYSSSKHQLILGVLERCFELLSALMCIYSNSVFENKWITFFEKLSKFDKFYFKKNKNYKRFQIRTLILIFYLILNILYDNCYGYFYGGDFGYFLLAFEIDTLYVTFQVLLMSFLVEIIEKRYDCLNQTFRTIVLNNDMETAAYKINKLYKSYRYLGELVGHISSYFGIFLLVYIVYVVIHVDFWLSNLIFEETTIPFILESICFPTLHCVSRSK